MTFQSVYTSSAWQIDYLTSIMVKPQGHSAHHPMKSSSSSAPRGSLSKGAQVGIIISAVIVGLLLITFCYYAIQGSLFVHYRESCHFDIYEAN